MRNTIITVPSSQEVEVGERKKAAVLWVPPPQLKNWQKIHVSRFIYKSSLFLIFPTFQSRVVRELEKKLSGKSVILISQRRILSKQTRKTVNKQTQKRPRSRTLTMVHEKMLEDIVYPAEIVGKRIRVKRDGKRLIKVHLDKANENSVNQKTDSFTAIYKKLTGKAVAFEFPEPLF